MYHVCKYMLDDHTNAHYIKRGCTHTRARAHTRTQLHFTAFSDECPQFGQSLVLKGFNQHVFAESELYKA